MFKFLKKKLAYRWSIYIVREKNELCYVLHHDAVFVLVGLIGSCFSIFGNPKTPYSIHLNFNLNHTAFKIDKTWFKSDGSPTKKLVNKIEEIDPDWIEGSIKGDNSPLPDLLLPSSYIKLNREEILANVFSK